MDAQTLARFRAQKPGMELTLTHRYPQRIEKLFAALSTPDRIAAWMDVEWLGDAAPLTVGSNFSYKFRNGDMVSEGRVTALQSPCLIEHSWFENIPPTATIRWSLQPDGDGCLLTLTHTTAGQDDACRNGAGWTMVIDQLDAWLAGRPFTPVKSWSSLRARYAASLGPAAMRDGIRLSIDGKPAVRFSRFLHQKVPEIWQFLTLKEKLDDWLGDVDVDLQPGGTFRIRFAMAPIVMEGTITAIDPESRLTMIWREPWFKNDDVTLDFRLQALGDGTLLTLTHIFPRDYDPQDYLAGWHEFMDALENAMQGTRFEWDTPERKRKYATLEKIYAAIAQAGG